jgi:hypothetical protein
MKLQTTVMSSTNTAKVTYCYDNASELLKKHSLQSISLPTRIHQYFLVWGGAGFGG